MNGLGEQLEILTDTLRDAQRVGFVGARPIPEVIDHARRFVGALDGVSGTVVDLGTGGGVPGLVVAIDRPDLCVVLVDRRQKRTDFLERAVARLGVGHRVEVRCDDVERMATRSPGAFDAVTARGFGPPQYTLRLAARMVVPDGPIVISEPPIGDRWDPRLLDELGLVLERRLGVACFRHAQTP